MGRRGAGMTQSKKAAPVVIQAKHPSQEKGELKDLGGSASDTFNNTLANQLARTLWLAHADGDERQNLISAAVAGLVGIGPKDELEGMLAGQLIAAHSAAMECYRRAMIPEQTFEGRKESLTQANKLSRTYATLLEALNRHRGKGQQKVTVEHVHVHEGGQAIVGSVETGGVGRRKNSETTLCKATYPCTSARVVGRRPGAGARAA